MFIAMSAMIASLDHFVVKLNTIYMTLLMVAPKAVIMVLLMQDMHKHKRMNAVILADSAVVFVGALLGIRTQAPMGDDELLRAMIPHHSGAILMYEQADLANPQVPSLCRDSTDSQRKEIADTQALLPRQW